MNQLIDRFVDQLQEALQIGTDAKINQPSQAIQNVYVAGLGGSGIGGDFVREFVYPELKVPYVVGKSYDVPAWISEHTLAIISSYSGNTEETLEAFAKIQNSGAKIVIISSGGKLIETAKSNGYDYIQVPGNWPSPRACLGYSLTQQMFILHHLGLISDAFIEQLKTSINQLKFNQDEIKKDAKTLAEFLKGRIPVIYTSTQMSAVAVRFRQQVNENAKQLCWHHIVPEMNHNELVGWKQPNDKLAVVYFRNKSDYKRNAVRIDINKEIINKYTPHIVELWSRGNSLIEQALYFVHLGDYASYYLSELNGEDSIEIDVIDYLKGELAKV